MKKTAMILMILAAVMMAASAFAVPPGKTVEFSNSPSGKVVFDGKIHADKGNKCNDCHTKLFQMKKGTIKITKADHGTDKGCGACHNGKKAFSQSDEANCGKCHKK